MQYRLTSFCHGLNAFFSIGFQRLSEQDLLSFLDNNMKGRDFLCNVAEGFWRIFTCKIVNTLTKGLGARDTDRPYRLSMLKSRQRQNRLHRNHTALAFRVCCGVTVKGPWALECPVTTCRTEVAICSRETQPHLLPEPIILREAEKKILRNLT